MSLVWNAHLIAISKRNKVMTTEQKELLFKDLSSRLPYGVVILHEGWNYEWDDSLSTWERVVGIDDKFIYTKVIDTHTKEEYREDKHSISLFDDKPYLRPMSSMTAEEKKEYESLRILIPISYNSYSSTYNLYTTDTMDSFDWLNANHFDYRGLIEKGLAIEVTEENNPYKE